MFIIQFMFLLPIVQLSTGFQIQTNCSNCGSILDDWKSKLSLKPENSNNRILVLYNKPEVDNHSQTIESLKFYLLRSDKVFKCNVDPVERNGYIYKIQKVTKENFCAQDVCEFYFNELKAGNYCIQMEILLSDYIDDYYSCQQCDIYYSKELISLKTQNETAAVIKVQSSRSDSHKKKTWIVVGSLVVIGVVLAFALERTYTRRHYASVPVVEMKELCLIENKNTLPGNLLAREVTGRLLVLYTYDSDVHFQLVKQFVDLLHRTLPNWEFILDQDHVNEICTLGTVRWVEDNFSRVDRVIFISSKRAFQQTSLMNSNFDVLAGNTDINYVFAIAWNFMLNDPKLRGNYAKVFNIRFECTRPEFTLNGVVPNRSFRVPSDYIELINHILGCNCWADAFCKDLKGTLRHMEPYLFFVDAVERLAREEGLGQVLGSQDFCWVRPGV